MPTVDTDQLKAILTKHIERLQKICDTRFGLHNYEDYLTASQCLVEAIRTYQAVEGRVSNG